MEWVQRLDVWFALAALGFGFYYLVWKDKIQPLIRSLFPPASPPPARRRGFKARMKHRPAIEMPRNRNEIISPVSVPVSGITTPNDTTETISFRQIAHLVRNGVVTETQLLEHVFGVKAGSSKAYQEKRTKLKAALAELEGEEERVGKLNGAAVH